MLIKNHWLNLAFKCRSPNYSERQNNIDISLIVIHCISLPPGQFGNDYIHQLFCNKLDTTQHPYFKALHQRKVSAHILIQRSGDITQYVAFNKCAWHAGISEFQGRSSCNNFSIGIELEGTENTIYTEIQYQQLAKLINSLLVYYPTLSATNVVGHSDIAPNRKTDPGNNFDWKKLQYLCR